jgi:hypothetical protein
MMGSPDREKDRGTDETLHQAELKHPFYVGKYPFTQERGAGTERSALEAERTATRRAEPRKRPG